ncbi:hypothetical protein Poli38472_001305 [Pythium oligandrum]|uniref:MYND-type domain-containing protein n=1 Tax=Pythium oligandrum TaxID=41045 RepID=A0A8K1FQ83_PYTOL|nr:hypothetical protein Poli38472_001305 [Pythium oligandrum]|eukprot:TMW69149.1 hypothetical protein Poli38472_001305 [Pythium oligandrum]
MPKEEYLSKTYQKWDNFKDDSDSENEDVPRMPTQFDTSGEDDIVVSTEMFLTSKQVDKFRKLDKPHQEIWQVVVRKLRVWSASSEGAAEGAEAIPCRPYCILVNNLYPLGQVISKKIVDPPEVYPSPQTILDVTLQAMLDPPTSTPQHRPDKIVFPDKHYVGMLRKSYSAIGIECSYLSESEGIDSYIQELSNHLVKNDLASVADVSERPGITSGEGVTPELLKPFYEACARYARLEPWKHLAERQAVQVDAREEIRVGKRHEAGRGTIFASVISSQTSQGQIQGMALFFTRADLERRVLPAGEKLALMENPELRRCAFCDKKAPKGGELKRCTRCKCTFYCGAECQRGHWKEHKISCVPEKDQAVIEQQQGNKIVWGAKEMSILFGAQTSLPFDDLDAIDRHELDVATVAGGPLYPSPMVFKYGEPNFPNASDIVWLTRGLLALSELIEKHPLFMQTSLGSLLGLDEDEDGNEKEQPKIEVECKTVGFSDHLVLRNSSVLTMPDVEKLRAYIQNRSVKKTETVDEGEEAKDSEGDAKQDQEDGSNCIVM